MMFSWTKSQEQAIKARGKRIIVSAAAGSGKTAILVERIIQRILDEDDPIDIDSFIVLTFTNAAAAQMRDRIRKRLEAEVEKDDIDIARRSRLSAQLSLIDTSKIMTIDSFCIQVLREHSDSIDIDPAFTVADESQLAMLKDDTLNDMLEEYFSDANQKLMDFADRYIKGKNYEDIKMHILKLYNHAQSKMWVDEWFESQKKSAMMAFEDDYNIDEQDYIKYIIGQIGLACSGALESIDVALQICNSPMGPIKYTDAIESDREQIAIINKLCESGASYIDVAQALSEVSWIKLGRNGKDVDPDKTTIVKGIRDVYKKAFEKISKFDCNMYSIIEDERRQSTYILTLLELTQDFTNRYSSAKRKKNLIDFSDAEHMVLKLLWQDDEEHSEKVLTDIAKEYSAACREIYIDEYQDSNDVQEGLLKAIERDESFVVGDVKQSIYKFRQARPELFIEKYDNSVPYEEGCEGEQVRIDLSENFRSRKDVLDSTNCVFENIMIREIGGIDYTLDARLNPAAVFPEPDIEGLRIDFPELDMKVPSTKLLVCDISTDEDEDVTGAENILSEFTPDNQQLSKYEIEAFVIANYIKEIMDSKNPMMIYDGDGYRPVRYSDIVILLRSAKRSAPIIADTLNAANIPAYTDISSGYFQTREISTIMSILSIIDNPYQDIPLVSYLRSAIVDLSDEKLALIQAAARKNEEIMAFPQSGRFYHTLLHIDSLGLGQELCEEIRAALELIETWRTRSLVLPLYELIRTIYEETGFVDIASCMPAGDIRRANLELLIDKAKAFADSGYRGLFQFIRYVENLQLYSVDDAEANLINENDNTVRITTIHKSKGLEYPICIVANIEKAFNTMDEDQAIIEDADLGVAMNIVDLDRHIRYKPLKKKILQHKMRSDTLGEELRVLYVAMTRAKEQLVLVGQVEKISDKLRVDEDNVKPHITSNDIRKCKSYLDFLILAGLPFDIEGYTLKRIVKATGQVIAAENQKTRITGASKKDEALELDRLINKPYEYSKLNDIKTKYTVTAIKDADRGEVAHAPFVKIDPYERAEHDEPNIGARRGTLYHKILQFIDYKALESIADDAYEKYIEDLIGRFVKEDERALINVKDIDAWLHSELACRMIKADINGKLHKESDFILQVPARKLKLALSDEMVLLQGKIDAWFEEDDKLFIVDYKTDKKADAQALIERYEGQMSLYASSLEQAYEKKVEKKYIWSFALKSALSL